ncbi:MAG TPA: VWA domain-containing protein [Gammaproteobacteria bacterium]|nr:VWA domain-containing protein [Gammaproteobacteria bacterium]
MDLNTLLSNYRLLQPEWLWLAIPVIIFILFRPFLIKSRWLVDEHSTHTATVKHPFADKDATPDKTTSPAKNRISWHSTLTLLYSSLMLLALSQPVKLGAEKTAPVTTADIILIIDTSISMVIRDYQVNGKRLDRLTMTKILLDRFIRNLGSRFPEQRTGIVIFGDPPQVLLKPSKDKNLVRHLIHRLKPTIAGRMAALGDAIAISVDDIKSDNIQNETILILISDGTTPSGSLSPVEGAKRASEANIILHTISVGSTETGKNNPSAAQMGELLYDSADIKLLEQIARITGGESFHGTDSASIDAALNRIEKRHQIESTGYLPRKQQSIYYWPLIVALFLFAIKEILTHNLTMRFSI